MRQSQLGEHTDELSTDDGTNNTLSDYAGESDAPSDDPERNTATDDDSERAIHDPPERCLSFRLSGPWGHFRRVEGNVIKNTYRIIPRTTLAGLVAAILGIGRDQYYELFGPRSSAIAVEPVTELRTMNLPANSLTTDVESLKRINSRGTVSISYPDPTEPRQRYNYEVLVDPAYRVDMWLADEDRYNQLQERLETGTAYYTPSLGLSEYLAEIDYLGEHDVTKVVESGPHTVDSAVPDPEGVVPDPQVNYGTERSPAFMEQTTAPKEFS